MIVGFWFLIVIGFSVLVGHTTFTKPFRDWLYSTGTFGEKVTRFLECPVCTGGQLAFWLSLYQPPFGFGHGRVIDAICASLAAIAACFLFGIFTGIIDSEEL